MKDCLITIHDQNKGNLGVLFRQTKNMRPTEKANTGEIYNLKYNRKINGDKTLNFNIDKYINGEENYRWNLFYTNNLIRFEYRGEVDWYIVSKPIREDGKYKTANISCDHISYQLTKKRTSLIFDDKNGIDTIKNLATKILSGTQWSLGIVDTFYEEDGETEKIRSIKTEGNENTYSLISMLCEKFNGYPIYNGETKTVDIRAMSAKENSIDLSITTNLSSLKIETNVRDIITKLYVKGAYDDLGFVGIDEINPTGAPFILNFDYYKEIGVFTSEHQQIYDKYLEDITFNYERIKLYREDYIRAESDIIGSIGQTAAAAYSSVSQFDSPYIEFLNTDNKKIEPGNRVFIQNDTTKKVEIKEYTAGMTIQSSDIAITFFDRKPGGKFGGIDIAIETYQTMIDNFNSDLEKETNEKKIENINNQITAYQGKMEEALAMLSDEFTSLYSDFLINYKTAKDSLDYQTNVLSNIEIEFASDMGEMLNEGEWFDSDYTIGQEQSLYDQSLEVLKRLSRPEEKYTISYKNIIHNFKEYNDNIDDSGDLLDHCQLNSVANILDNNLSGDDNNKKYRTYVEEIEEHIPEYENSTIKVSSSELSVTASTYSSILTRISEIVNVINERKEIIDRAKSIEKDGSIPMDLLKGAINANTQKMLSVSSGWSTDEQGNIIFTTIDGSSAMMLSGMGFMIANSHKENGDWNWRTFGTGEGFTADLITTGFLSAERILAGSITTAHLSAGVFEELLIDAKELITIEVSNAIKDIDFDIKIPNLIRNSKEINVDILTEEYDSIIIFDSDLKEQTSYMFTVESIFLVRGINTLPVLITGENASGAEIEIGSFVLNPSNDIQEFKFNSDENYKNVKIILNRQNDTIYILSNVKLAEGTSYSGWIPHYDDFYESIQENRARIEVESNKITQTVESIETVNKEILDLKSEDEAIRTTIASEIKQESDKVNISFTTIQEYIEKVESEAKAFEQEVRTDIRFDDKGMSIGRSDSPFSARFDNNELGFYENNLKIAYFSNQRLDVLSVISDRVLVRYDALNAVELTAPTANNLVGRIVRNY